MARDYTNPQWLNAIAGILYRQAGRCRDESRADLTRQLAAYFEARARSGGMAR